MSATAFLRCFVGAAIAFSASALARATTPPIDHLPAVVRHATVNPDVPIFVPVNPRIATTITFPKPIGEPVGTGFIDADALQRASDGKTPRPRGEYVLAFTSGDPFFTVQPLPRSEMLNLNVPYEGSTIVLYFYTVDQPLDAVASLIFAEPGLARKGDIGRGSGADEGVSPKNGADATAAAPPIEPTNAGDDRIQKSDTLPATKTRTASPARLEGFLRKLRFVHAAKPGPELDDIAGAMNVSVAISTAERPDAHDITHPVTDAGPLQIILLRAVRDPAIDSVGFIVLLRNRSDNQIALDARTFSARCGAAFYTARVIDAPARLGPREVQPGYFVVVGSGDGRPGNLSSGNDWRISVAILDPTSSRSNAAPTPRPSDPINSEGSSPR